MGCPPREPGDPDTLRRRPHICESTGGAAASPPMDATVTEVHDGHVRKLQCRHQCLEMMVTVNDIGWNGQTCKIVDDGNGQPAEFFSHRSEHETEGDRMVPASQQRLRNVPQIGFRTSCSPSVLLVKRTEIFCIWQPLWDLQQRLDDWLHVIRVSKNRRVQACLDPSFTDLFVVRDPLLRHRHRPIVHMPEELDAKRVPPVPVECRVRLTPQRGIVFRCRQFASERSSSRASRSPLPRPSG